ncbi:hypothetical protein RLDS_21610 [Sphingobium lactosutens DS20]|uniref:Uncharacterized protein n=1 Tax=Sphingobium lactosutens DS20 TaxID=1331060 RepID=T0H5Y2_9SPHN|nr:hypothetical protein RLDS_21610 [Sphingobium lactosutens DS20]
MRLDEAVESPPLACFNLLDQVSFVRILDPCHEPSFAAIAGQGLGDLPIELLLLRLVKQAPHGEDVAHGCLLEFTHLHMDLIDGRTDLGTVGMFLLHGSRQIDIGRAKLRLQSCTFCCELVFKLLQPGALIRAEVEFVVYEIMQALALRLRPPLSGNEGADTSRGHGKQDSKDDVETR